MSHWVELREKNMNHWCRMDEGVVRRSHLLPLPLPGMGTVALGPLWQWVVTRDYFSCQLKSRGEHAGVGGLQIMLSTGSSAKTSMCFIEQMLLVQYGISFRFIFALGLTHFLFRILKKITFMVLRWEVHLLLTYNEHQIRRHVECWSHLFVAIRDLKHM